MRLIDRMRSGRAGYWEGMASGAAVLTTSYGSADRESILPNLARFAQDSYTSNTVVFAAILARLMLFSEVRFKFQDESDGSLSILPPRAGILENPWPNGTTGELCARLIQDVDLAGNAYIARGADQLIRLRPDQVTIVSHEVTDRSTGNPYRQVIGYIHDPGSSGNAPAPSADARHYTVDEVCHWSPIPDPWAEFRGMSWLTPVLREILADNAMTDYKQRYLANAASPNLLIKYRQKLMPETIDAIRERMQARYGGADNAFKTLVLDQGADTTVIGNSFEQMQFATVQSAGEARILAASGVPPIVCGVQAGLDASTYSNYAQAMRKFADFMRPLWRSCCASLSKFVAVPSGSRLWYDTTGIAALRQGEKEAADTMLVQAQAIGDLVRYGYDPLTARDAVVASDMSLLTHTGIPIMITSDVPLAKPAPIVLPYPGAPDPTSVPADTTPGKAAAAAATLAATNGSVNGTTNGNKGGK